MLPSFRLIVATFLCGFAVVFAGMRLAVFTPVAAAPDAAQAHHGATLQLRGPGLPEWRQADAVVPVIFDLRFTAGDAQAPLPASLHLYAMGRAVRSAVDQQALPEVTAEPAVLAEEPVPAVVLPVSAPVTPGEPVRAVPVPAAADVSPAAAEPSPTRPQEIAPPADHLPSTTGTAPASMRAARSEQPPQLAADAVDPPKPDAVALLSEAVSPAEPAGPAIEEPAVTAAEPTAVPVAGAAMPRAEQKTVRPASRAAAATKRKAGKAKRTARPRAARSVRTATRPPQPVQTPGYNVPPPSPTAANPLATLFGNQR